MRLPKAPGFNDLWSSQADALKLWFKRRTERDLVIKLNTGGGKTLVGLLIAQSIVNEHRGPVLYLCPTVQLRDQIIDQSKQYGISAVPYVSGQGDPITDDFLGARAVMVATYQALFNGRSRFGLTGSSRGAIDLKGIVLDDAHTAFSTMRDIFSLPVRRDDNAELYDELTSIFRNSFSDQGRLGTFDDIVAEREDHILEIPYVSWANRSGEVRQRLSEIADSHFRFAWPLVRDSFSECHVLVGTDQIVITPFQPIVDLFPSFANCPNRIYMSATVADDSSIVRTFNADRDSVSKPIAPASLAGVGERMILIPELIKIDSSAAIELTTKLATKVAEKAGVVILTSSRASADRWSEIATVVQGNDVAHAVSQLVDGKSKGPYAFPNRYDGIDLPANSCRMLILSGLPYGANAYDLYRAAVLEGSGTINATLAQRVEQGMGRGTRGRGDHCVILLLGKDLVGWISRSGNLELLTSATQEQVRIGIDVSQEISSPTGIAQTVGQCLNRSPDWVTFHADRLADATIQAEVDDTNLQIASLERQCFDLARHGYHEKAIRKIERYCARSDCPDDTIRGWLLQFAARWSHQREDFAKRDSLQHEAFSLNRSLQRPITGVDYRPLRDPSRQAEGIAKHVYEFPLIRGALADFESIANQLVPTASSNQFEEALKRLGSILGFVAERPDRELGVGPDVLWILNERKAWIVEVKSRKKPENKLTRDEQWTTLAVFGVVPFSLSR